VSWLLPHEFLHRRLTRRLMLSRFNVFRTVKVMIFTSCNDT
jgi:hypothetical protein